MRFILMLVCFVLVFGTIVFAIVDSAAVINGINAVGQISEAVAKSQGKQEAATLITAITGAVCALASFFFGHAAVVIRKENHPIKK